MNRERKQIGFPKKDLIPFWHCIKDDIELSHAHEKADKIRDTPVQSIIMAIIQATNQTDMENLLMTTYTHYQRMKIKKFLQSVDLKENQCKTLIKIESF